MWLPEKSSSRRRVLLSESSAPHHRPHDIPIARLENSRTTRPGYGCALSAMRRSPNSSIGRWASGGCESARVRPGPLAHLSAPCDRRFAPRASARAPCPRPSTHQSCRTRPCSATPRGPTVSRTVESATLGRYHRQALLLLSHGQPLANGPASVEQ